MRDSRLSLSLLLLLTLMMGAVLGVSLKSAPPPIVNPTPLPTASTIVTERPASDQLPKSFADVVEKVQPSVVSVNAIQVIPGYRHPFADDPMFQYYFGPDRFSAPEQRIQSAGSGVIISPDGLIVTNSHVVNGVQEVSVSLSDNRTLPAEIVGVDPASDLALLRTRATDLPAATWGSSDSMRVGDWVLAFGSPFSLSRSVSHGILSAKGRKGLGIADYENFLQTDASINPGNSGGPLVNTAGEVVGINTAILSHSGGSQGVGLAVPAEVAREVLDQLLEHGHIDRGWMGLFVQEVTPEAARQLGIAEPRGALVVGGYRNAPAAASGVELYDAIIEVNGQPVTNVSTFRNLMAETKVGDKARLKVLRRGETTELEVTVIARPVDPAGRPLQGI